MAGIDAPKRAAGVVVFESKSIENPVASWVNAATGPCRDVKEESPTPGRLHGPNCLRVHLRGSSPCAAWSIGYGRGSRCREQLL